MHEVICLHGAQGPYLAFEQCPNPLKIHFLVVLHILMSNLIKPLISFKHEKSKFLC